MSTTDCLDLRPPNSAASPISLRPSALTNALVCAPPLITPAWKVQHRDQLVLMPDHPERPWLDDFQRSAVIALRAGDPDRAEYLCRRTLEFARPKDHHAAVSQAQFILSYLEAVAGQYAAAAERLGKLTTGPDRFQAVVQNNFAYVQCRLRQPVLAARLWLTAVEIWPKCVPAWISLRNVAEIMLSEAARSCGELPSWSDLRNQAREGLKKILGDDVRRWIGLEAPFPAYESALIYPVEHHSPPLSSHLPADDTGRPAARQLLADASIALAAGRPELADALAARAAVECPRLAWDVREVRSQAQRQLAERDRLAAAERLHRLLDRFHCELDKLTLQDPSSPQETLALIEALTNDPQTLDQCRSLYRRRLTRLYQDAAEECHGDERRHWLRLATEPFESRNKP